MPEVPIHIIHLPEYQVLSEPDSEFIGRVIDDFFRQHFLGQEIVFRGVASSEHPNKSQDALIELIKISGTDRYNPEQKGDRYENIENKNIDFFGFKVKVSAEMKIGYMLIWGFYHSAIAVHGHPMRIDIISVYDSNRIEQVKFTYEGREHEGKRDDGFAFKNTKDKPKSLKAIIKITG